MWWWLGRRNSQPTGRQSPQLAQFRWQCPVFINKLHNSTLSQDVNKNMKLNNNSPDAQVNRRIVYVHNGYSLL